jgi:general stress protein YciG
MHDDSTKPNLKRGFARLTPEERSALGRKGGKATWKAGKAHQFERGEEASRLGKLGGKASQEKRRESAASE